MYSVRTHILVKYLPLKVIFLNIVLLLFTVFALHYTYTSIPFYRTCEVICYATCLGKPDPVKYDSCFALIIDNLCWAANVFLVFFDVLCGFCGGLNPKL